MTQSCLPRHLRQVLDLVLRRHEVAGGEVAAELGLDPSTAHRHLVALHQEGFVHRVEDRKVVRYRPRAHTRALFVGPLGTWTSRQTPPWGRLEWDVEDVVDWRFPLVFRIPDAEGRRTAHRLLVNAFETGLLTPWLKVHPEGMQQVLDRFPAQREEVLRWLQAPATHEGFTFVVYGSCARGDARRDSDLDLLVIGPAHETWQAKAERDLGLKVPYWDHGSAVQKLVDDMNLGSARHIDMAYIERSDFFDGLGKDLQTAIQTEGITIYSSAGPEFIESTRWATDG